MNMDFDLGLNDSLKDKYVRQSAFRKNKTTTLNHLKLQLYSPKLTANQDNSSFINNQSFNNLFCVNCSSNGDGSEFTKFKYQKEETEKQLEQFLDVQHENQEVMGENDSYRKFLEYIKINYDNKFKAQNLTNKDLKIQIEELLKRIKSLKNKDGISQKNIEDLLERLRQKQEENLQRHQKQREFQRKFEDQKRKNEFLKEEAERLRNLMGIKSNKINDMVEEMKAEEKKFASKKKEMDEVIKNLREKVRQDKSEIRERDKVINKFQMDLIGMKDENKKLKSNALYPVSSMDEYQDQIDQKNKELYQVMKDNNSLKKQLKKAKQKAEDSNSKLNKMKRRQDALNNAMKKGKKVSMIYMSNKDQNQEMIKSLKLQILEQESQIHKLKTELDKEKFNTKKMGNEMAFKDKVAGNLEDENKRLKEKLAELKRSMKENSSPVVDSLKMKKEKSDLLQRLTEANNKLVKKEQKLREIAMKMKRQKGELREANFTIDELREDLDLLNQRFKKEKMLLKEEIESLENQYKDKKKNKNQMSLQMSKLNKFNQESEGKIHSMLQEIDALEKRNAELKKKNKYYEQDQEMLMRNIDDLNRNLKKMRKKQRELEEEVESNKIMIHNLEVDLNSTKIENDKFQRENEKLKRAGSNRQRYLDETNADLVKERERAKINLHNYNNEKGKNDDLILENTKLKDGVKELEGKVRRLKEDLKSYERTEKAQEQFEVLNVNFENNQKEIEELTGRNRDLKEDVEHLKDELAELQFEHNNLKIEKEKYVAKSKKSEEYYLRIFNETFRANYMVEDVKEFLIEDEVSEHLPNPIKTIPKEQLPAKILEYLDQTSNKATDIMEELDDIKKALNNLKEEKTKLLVKFHDLEEQFNDLTFRHDKKTDKIGKLTIKCYVLMSEIERQAVKRKQN